MGRRRWIIPDCTVADFRAALYLFSVHRNARWRLLIRRLLC